MKATFIQRATAYIIDSLIIGIILSIVTVGIKTDNSKFEEKINKLYNDVSSEKITISEYATEYCELLYENQNNNLILNILNVALIIVYFVVFQYLNKGQSIGKKLMKIKIVDNNKKDISITQMFIRGLMVYQIISGLINLLLLFKISSVVYMTTYMSAIIIESLLIMISAIFILYRNDKRALHDIASKSMVIRVK